MRGPLPQRERNVLIGANMHRSQRVLTKSVQGRGKALVLFSPEREFIFGDGFYHNLYPPAEHMNSIIMLVPVTPWISVLYVQPSAFQVEPRLVTMTVNMAEAASLNRVVQVHAKDAVFYRSEAPPIKAAFRHGEHLVFEDGHNPVDQFVRLIPSIYPVGGLIGDSFM